MALVIPPGFAQASVEQRHDNDPDPWYCTFGVDLSGAGGDLAAAALNIANAWANNALPTQATAVSMTGVRLVVGQDGPDNLISFLPTNAQGQNTSAVLPQNCALLVDKTSALGGKKNRGRMFVPGGITEGDVSATGVLAASYRSALQGRFDDFLEGLENGQFTISTPTPMVILHNSGAGATPAPTPVIALGVQATISTQRRRLR
jgi:hypothetical protein